MGHVTPNQEFVELAARAGWKRAEIARRMNLSKSIVGAYFSGQQQPDSSRIAHLRQLVDAQQHGEMRLNESPAPYGTPAGPKLELLYRAQDAIRELINLELKGQK